VTVFVAFALGLGVGVLAWWSLGPTFDHPALARQNHRGATVATAGGLVLVLTAVVLEGGARLLEVIAADNGAVPIDPATRIPRLMVLVATLGLGALGLVDDLVGTGESGGFRGHLSALGRGRLTTGSLKLFGGAAVCLVAVSLAIVAAPGRFLADAALVALAANLGNLLDRAPGRVGKAALVLFAVLVVATGFDPTLAGTAVVIGAGAALLIPDLRERVMLGDAGANVVGAALGVGVVVSCGPGVRTVVLVVLVALNLISEVVSFSAVIDRVPPLRAADRLGRRAG
jgi:UDP-N-acetylmuramyl pentapeptide phosphotransferase/UDP-N-acetylglucosamine-1-phosphate transferase